MAGELAGENENKDQKSPLYSQGTDIYTIDRGASLFYYFQSNKDGSAKVKQELRYARSLWNDCSQLRLRIPVITRHPVTGNPYSGLGNIELSYMYKQISPDYDRSWEVRIAAPTASNHVESLDTQFKAFYFSKWKWDWGSFTYLNEYDQTFIQPAGASYTSYYEGYATVPNAAIGNTGIKFAGIYNYRVLFDTGGIYKSAAGGMLYGNLNDVALTVYDTWGVGEHGLWRYKVEGNATVRW